MISSDLLQPKWCVYIDIERTTLKNRAFVYWIGVITITILLNGMCGSRRDRERERERQRDKVRRFGFIFGDAITVDFFHSICDSNVWCATTIFVRHKLHKRKLFNRAPWMPLCSPFIEPVWCRFFVDVLNPFATILLRGVVCFSCVRDHEKHTKCKKLSPNKQTEGSQSILKIKKMVGTLKLQNKNFVFYFICLYNPSKKIKLCRHFSDYTQ